MVVLEISVPRFLSLGQIKFAENPEPSACSVGAVGSAQMPSSRSVSPLSQLPGVGLLCPPPGTALSPGTCLPGYVPSRGMAEANDRLARDGRGLAPFSRCGTVPSQLQSSSRGSAEAAGEPHSARLPPPPCPASLTAFQVGLPASIPNETSSCDSLAENSAFPRMPS